MREPKAALAKDNGSVPGPEKGLHNLYAGIIESWRAKIKSLQETKHQLGTVFAGSGLLRTKKVQRGDSIRGWVLIEPERDTGQKHVS